MDFGLSDEQAMLQDSLRRHLAANAALARSRRFAADKETRAADVIAGLAELGATGIVTSPEQGGLGLSLLDAALVAELLGEHVTPAPFIASNVLVPLALQRMGSPAQQARWLPALAAGTAVAGAALSEATGAREDARVRASGGKLDGRALAVLDFAADVYLVADDADGLHLVEAGAPGLTATALTTIDLTRPIGELRFAGVAAAPLPGADAAGVRALIDTGRVMLAADALGAAQAMLGQAVEYAKTREQFGRPIASFQAVKHMCAEMAAALEPCRAMMWFAAHALEALPEEASTVAAHTKAHVCEVATRVAKTATEVHGGMGFTDLVGLHYWFKRIGFDRQMLGSPQTCRADAARLAGLDAAAA